MDIWDRVMQLPVLRIFEPLYAEIRKFYYIYSLAELQ